MATHLESLGFVVRDLNWSGAGAELDLVVARGTELRFVEVKARQVGDPTALESVDHRKRRQLTRGARAWLAQHEPDADELAFMVAVVEFAPAGWTVEILDDAFDAV
ncbi:MAG: YraN family protein [Myxococcales bacterium]|nr:YraN family protein [Myxococcales bacterium]